MATVPQSRHTGSQPGLTSPVRAEEPSGGGTRLSCHSGGAHRGGGQHDERAVRGAAVTLPGGLADLLLAAPGHPQDKRGGLWKVGTIPKGTDPGEGGHFPQKPIKSLY